MSEDFDGCRALIDRVGRKTLLLIGALGLTAMLGGVAAVFLTARHHDLLLWVLIGFIAFLPARRAP